jgi:hypothetical protein
VIRATYVGFFRASTLLRVTARHKKEFKRSKVRPTIEVFAGPRVQVTRKPLNSRMGKGGGSAYAWRRSVTAGQVLGVSASSARYPDVWGFILTTLRFRLPSCPVASDEGSWSRKARTESRRSFFARKVDVDRITKDGHRLMVRLGRVIWPRRRRRSWRASPLVTKMSRAVRKFSRSLRVLYRTARYRRRARRRRAAPLAARARTGMAEFSMALNASIVLVLFFCLIRDWSLVSTMVLLELG